MTKKRDSRVRNRTHRPDAAGGLYLGRGVRPSEPRGRPRNLVPVNGAHARRAQDPAVGPEFFRPAARGGHRRVSAGVAGRLTEVAVRGWPAGQAGDILFVIDPPTLTRRPWRAPRRISRRRRALPATPTSSSSAPRLVRTQARLQQVYDSAPIPIGRRRRDQGRRGGTETGLSSISSMPMWRAPITGRASRAELTVGNLLPARRVRAALTTIVGNHTIYAISRSRAGLCRDPARLSRRTRG